MAAKVINFHSPDGKNTYELTFTRDSVEATERAGFQIGQYTQMTNLLSNSRALFYGAFIARNKGIKRKVVDEMFQHIEDKEDLMGILLEMFMDALVILSVSVVLFSQFCFTFCYLCVYFGLFLFASVLAWLVCTHFFSSHIDYSSLMCISIYNGTNLFQLWKCLG